MSRKLRRRCPKCNTRRDKFCPITHLCESCARRGSPNGMSPVQSATWKKRCAESAAKWKERQQRGVQEPVIIDRAGTKGYQVGGLLLPMLERDPSMSEEEFRKARRTLKYALDAPWFMPDPPTPPSPEVPCQIPSTP